MSATPNLGPPAIRQRTHFGGPRATCAQHPSVPLSLNWQVSPIYFGRVEHEAYPAAEFILYHTDFFAVALGRDRRNGWLIGSTIDTD